MLEPRVVLFEMLDILLHVGDSLVSPSANELKATIGIFIEHVKGIIMLRMLKNYISDIRH